LCCIAFFNHPDSAAAAQAHEKSNTAKNDSNETVLKPHMTCYYYGDQGGAKPPRESVNGTI